VRVSVPSRPAVTDRTHATDRYLSDPDRDRPTQHEFSDNHRPQSRCVRDARSRRPRTPDTFATQALTPDVTSTSHVTEDQLQRLALEYLTSVLPEGTDETFERFARNCATKVDRSPSFLQELMDLGEQRAEEFLSSRRITDN